ncbi:MAG TPA: M3 family oligoendopeptidase, partial [Clostridia bacterium]|nr:M3 family oligoendopeptidase [Clostridia bacterium]
LPKWNLADLYDGVESREYTALKQELIELTDRFAEEARNGSLRNTYPAGWLQGCLELYNRLGDSYEELDAFVSMWYTTSTTDQAALAELNSLEELGLGVQAAEVSFKNSVAEIADRLPEIFKAKPALAEYRFFLEEQLFFQQHQMSEKEESLAADLMRSGGNAWGRLFQAVSSTAAAEWEELGGNTTGRRDEPSEPGLVGAGGKKTVTELRGMAFDPDRSVRHKAWLKELEAVEQVEIPLAAAINGVKGSTVSISRRRGYESVLEKSVQQARISRATLDALIGVMEESLPVFREYLSGKARLLGLERLSFYDIFAPVTAQARSKLRGEGADYAGSRPERWSYSAARDFILTHFRSFSAELADFAAAAFKKGWIDAQPRAGKVGGAYCITLPLTGETRVMCNFSGNFGDVKTIAHELGHAYHHYVLRDAPHLFRQYPMTLAETASIFAESVVIDGALQAAAPEEKLPIVEKLLQDSTQVIVDILSRFKFESAVLEGREQGELSPKELKRQMLEAQTATYGDALNPDEMHPYMWAVKPHYYSPELAFYNFPYAFGQLFGLGLYNRYVQEGSAFLPVYRDVLLSTGRGSAVEVTRTAGFDIESPEFWRSGIATIKERVDEFLKLLPGT